MYSDFLKFSIACSVGNCTNRVLLWAFRSTGGGGLACGLHLGRNRLINSFEFIQRVQGPLVLVWTAGLIGLIGVAWVVLL